MLLGFAIVESFVHYLDNTVRYDDYTVDNPSVLGGLVKQWVIPIAWVLFTAAGLLGYKRFKEGQWSLAAIWLAVYSVSGLISVLHYTDISLDDLSPFQNTFVFMDIAAGLAILGFAIWTATRKEKLVVDFKSA